MPLWMRLPARSAPVTRTVAAIEARAFTRRMRLAPLSCRRCSRTRDTDPRLGCVAGDYRRGAGRTARHGWAMMIRAAPHVPPVPARSARSLLSSAPLEQENSSAPSLRLPASLFPALGLLTSSGAPPRSRRIRNGGTLRGLRRSAPPGLPCSGRVKRPSLRVVGLAVGGCCFSGLGPRWPPLLRRGLRLGSGILARWASPPAALLGALDSLRACARSMSRVRGGGRHRSHRR